MILTRPDANTTYNMSSKGALRVIRKLIKPYVFNEICKQASRMTISTSKHEDMKTIVKTFYFSMIWIRPNANTTYNMSPKGALRVIRKLIKPYVFNEICKQAS